MYQFQDWSIFLILSGLWLNQNEAPKPHQLFSKSQFRGPIKRFIGSSNTGNYCSVRSFNQLVQLILCGSCGVLCREIRLTLLTLVEVVWTGCATLSAVPSCPHLSSLPLCASLFPLRNVYHPFRLKSPLPNKEVLLPALLLHTCSGALSWSCSVN